MSDRTVCDMKPLLFVCLLFGYYQDLHPSHSFRLFAKLYCLLLLGICTVTFYFICGEYPWYIVYPQYIEYTSLVLFSLLFKYDYISQHYRYIPFVDGVPISKKFLTLNTVVNKLIPAVFLMELIYFIFLYYTQLGPDHKIIIIFAISISLATQFRRLPIILRFILLYYRVKIMRATLETNGFENTPRRRFQPQKYIQMYGTLMDTLENNNFYIKLTWFMFLSCGITPLFCEVFVLLLHIQESIYNIKSFLMWLIKVYIIEFQIVIISAIVSDLIKYNLQKMKIIVIKKRANCNNERERAEIQKLYHLIQTRPYVYTLARIFPLEIRSLLGFISYLITTIIAILQIKRIAF